jgi:polygalacturonase
VLSVPSALILCISNTVGTNPSTNESQNLQWTKNVDAQQMPDKDDVFNVADYGAVNDDKTLNTKAIKAAIDDSGPSTNGIDIDSSTLTPD